VHLETAIWKLKRKITDLLIRKLENSSTSVHSNKILSNTNKNIVANFEQYR